MQFQNIQEKKNQITIFFICHKENAKKMRVSEKNRWKEKLEIGRILRSDQKKQQKNKPI